MLDVFHSRDVCSTLLAGDHGKKVCLGGIPSHQKMADSVFHVLWGDFMHFILFIYMLIVPQYAWSSPCLHGFKIGLYL